MVLTRWDLGAGATERFLVHMIGAERDDDPRARVAERHEVERAGRHLSRAARTGQRWEHGATLEQVHDILRGEPGGCCFVLIVESGSLGETIDCAHGTVTLRKDGASKIWKSRRYWMEEPHTLALAVPDPSASSVVMYICRGTHDQAPLRLPTYLFDVVLVLALSGAIAMYRRSMPLASLVASLPGSPTDASIRAYKSELTLYELDLCLRKQSRGGLDVSLELPPDVQGISVPPPLVVAAYLQERRQIAQRRGRRAARDSLVELVEHDLSGIGEALRAGDLRAAGATLAGSRLHPSWLARRLTSRTRPRIMAMLALQRADLGMQRGDAVSAIRDSDRACKLFESLGERSGIVEAELVATAALRIAGRLAEARCRAERVREYTNDNELRLRPGTRAAALAASIAPTIYLGDFSAAERQAQEGLTAAEIIGEPMRVAESLVRLAQTVLAAGRVDLAEGYLERAELASNASGTRWLTTWAARTRLDLVLASGEHLNNATDWFSVAWEENWQSGNKFQLTLLLPVIASLATVHNLDLTTGNKRLQAALATFHTDMTGSGPSHCRPAPHHGTLATVDCLVRHTSALVLRPPSSGRRGS